MQPSMFSPDSILTLVDQDFRPLWKVHRFPPDSGPRVLAVEVVIAQSYLTLLRPCGSENLRTKPRFRSMNRDAERFSSAWRLTPDAE